MGSIARKLADLFSPGKTTFVPAGAPIVLTDASGTYTPSAGVRAIRFQLQAGGGAGGGATNTNASEATCGGGGGGAALNKTSSAAQPGGDGTPGCIIVTEYF